MIHQPDNLMACNSDIPIYVFFFGMQFGCTRKFPHHLNTQKMTTKQVVPNVCVIFNVT